MPPVPASDDTGMAVLNSAVIKSVALLPCVSQGCLLPHHSQEMGFQMGRNCSKEKGTSSDALKLLETADSLLCLAWVSGPLPYGV